MKKLKLTLLIALMCAPVMAEEATCKERAEVGEAIMFARQSGVPLSRLMEMEDLKPLREVIIGVYKVDVKSSESAKQKAINEFRDAVAMDCYSNGGE